MTTGALSAGEIVHLMVWRWQWEDGLTTHLGSTVAWNLAMYTNNVETYPELLTTLTARAEPVVYSDRDVPEPPYTVILHSGPLAADYDSATPLTGDVEVTGVLVPDWYDRTHPALPPTHGSVIRYRLVEADVIPNADALRVARGTLRLSEIARAPRGGEWSGHEYGPNAQLGVLVYFRLR